MSTSVDERLSALKGLADTYVQEINQPFGPNAANKTMKKIGEVAGAIDKEGGIERLASFLKSEDVPMKVAVAAYLFVYREDYKAAAVEAFRELVAILPKQSHLLGVCQMYVTIAGAATG